MRQIKEPKLFTKKLIAVAIVLVFLVVPIYVFAQGLSSSEINGDYSSISVTTDAGGDKRVNYGSDWFDMNVTLSVNRGALLSTVNDVFITLDDNNDFKFGANVPGDFSTQRFKYEISSSRPIIKNNLLGYYIERNTESSCLDSFSFNQQTLTTSCIKKERHEFNFKDICKSKSICTERIETLNDNPETPEIEVNVTYVCDYIFEPECEFTLQDNVLTVEFYGEYDSVLDTTSIDPTITISDISTATSVKNNITCETEDKYCHVNVSDSNIRMYLNFDIDDASISTTETIVNDWSENNNNGDFSFYGANGHPNITGNGWAGRGLIFDGIEDANSPTSMYVADDDSLDCKVGFQKASCSFCAWVKPGEDESTLNVILAKNALGNNKGMRWRLLKNSTGYYQVFRAKSNLAEVFSNNNSWTPNEWNHLCVTNLLPIGGGDSAKFYRNGNAVGTGAAGQQANNANPVYIGHDGILTGSTFNGTLDEIMWIKSALSASAILDIYNNQSSRFKHNGEQIFENKDLSGVDDNENRVNITINDSTLLLGTMINVSIGGSNGTDYIYGDEFELVNNKANNIPLTNPQNSSIKFRYIVFDDTKQFYSPAMKGDVTADSTFIDSCNLLTNPLIVTCSENCTIQASNLNNRDVKINGNSDGIIKISGSDFTNTTIDINQCIVDFT